MSTSHANMLTKTDIILMWRMTCRRQIQMDYRRDTENPGTILDNRNSTVLFRGSNLKVMNLWKAGDEACVKNIQLGMVHVSVIAYSTSTIFIGRKHDYKPLRTGYGILLGRMFFCLEYCIARNGLLFILRAFTEPQKFGLDQNLPFWTSPTIWLI